MPDRWGQIEELYHQAIERDPDERSAFLAEACAGDEALRSEVESLIAYQKQAAPLLEKPALDVAARSLAKGDPRTLAGQKIGSYEILSLVGAGGMGEVYRARDTRLGRSVALKFLPDAPAQDPERIARFEREAKLLASLNHPNIAALYGLEEFNGRHFLVMELVEGETLAERIARGPIPVDEALNMAHQIAEALEVAHENGIIHRDLKPANVKVTPEDKVKVLDFGLAKALPTAAAQANMMSSPKPDGPSTNAGMILGTAAYMSPEQAKGLAADPRSDVFSFGCILYEMLTGKAVFARDSVSETLAAVLNSDPDIHLLPTTLAPRLRELLERTLAKNPKHRFHAIADVRLEIESILRSPSSVSPHEVTRVRTPRLAWVLIAIALVAFVSVAIVHFNEQSSGKAPEMRLEIHTPSTSSPLEFALSPDGRYIVFVASGDGPQRLWLRALNKTEAQPLAGTEGAAYPFWSTDSRSIGFYTTGKLKRTEIAGGPPQVLASTAAVFGGSWNADGTILLSAFPGPLFRMNASGGEPVAVTRVDSPRQVQQRFPRFLSDGKHFLYFGAGTAEASGVYLGSVDGGVSKRLTNGLPGASIAPGMIAFMRGTALVAQHLDLDRGELTGDPVIVADPVGFLDSGYGGFSVSANGHVAYRAGGLRQLKWFDRAGKVIQVTRDPDAANLSYPELSPDGRHVVLQRRVQGNGDIWLMDLVRHGMSRFTFDPAIEVAPLWSPDGTRIVFSSGRKGRFDLFIKPSSGAEAEELLLETPDNKYAQDWSKDSRFLLYSVTDPTTGRDLYVLPMSGDRKSIVVAKTGFEELNGQFSPDGRWVAYETNESGRFEIVVQPFPVPSGKWQVSTGGGVQPRWRADGKELYFIAPERKLMAASVTASGTTFAAGMPVALFPVKIPPNPGTNKHQYMVSRDGRFLVNTVLDDEPITILLNWKPPAR